MTLLKLLAVVVPHWTWTADPVLLANFTYYWNRFLTLLYNTFCTRERMIQLTIIGVIVGLFIMLRKMPGKE
ncbi:MAG: hypothetical protein NZM31_03865 [Gemmatales bacterium]|nr:hypothetical protein [Gemmatales bacterium]MDW8386135.1 hypothetical protein [Gemmatales bacterium]